MTNTVIITGAASGIGAATVNRYLSTTNFNILAVDKDAQGLDELVVNAPLDFNQRVTIIAIDLTDEQMVAQRLISQVHLHGSVEHVVISHAIGIDNAITENDKWDSILNINLQSTQRLLSMLADSISDGGRLVVMSSVLGRAGKAMNTGYVTSKHALLGLVKALAMDWAPRKITVNAVLPCWVDTPMLHRESALQAARLGLPIKQAMRRIKRRIPLRNLISPYDVADTVMFLTSPAARMITAQSIVVDGGFGCGV